MQTLLSIFRTTNHLLSLSVADLTDEVARRRTRGNEGPSVVWTIGHMLHHRHGVLASLGEQRPNPWAESFGKAAATDGADYRGLTAMRAEWDEMHQALEEAFAKAAPDVLDQPVPGGIHGETKVRDNLSFVAWHEGYHMGVVGAIRLAAGLPGPADLARAAAAKH